MINISEEIAEEMLLGFMQAHEIYPDESEDFLNLKKELINLIKIGRLYFEGLEVRFVLKGGKTLTGREPTAMDMASSDKAVGDVRKACHLLASMFSVDVAEIGKLSIRELGHLKSILTLFT